MTKYNLSNIMKRAWEIKRENKKNIFGLCLKMAWAEAKAAKEAAEAEEKELSLAEKMLKKAQTMGLIGMDAYEFGKEEICKISDKEEESFSKRKEKLHVRRKYQEQIYNLFYLVFPEDRPKTK